MREHNYTHPKRAEDVPPLFLKDLEPGGIDLQSVDFIELSFAKHLFDFLNPGGV